MAQKQELNPVWKAAKPFANGGLSGMLSTCIIQPIDMVKVRLQLGEKGSPVSTRATAGLTDRRLLLLTTLPRSICPAPHPLSPHLACSSLWPPS